MTDPAPRPRHTAAIAGGAVLALLVGWVVIGLLATLVLGALAVGVYLFMRSRSTGAHAAVPDASATGGPVAAAATPQAPPTNRGPGAAALVEQVRQDCVAQGFFLEHRVTVQQATRRNPASATLTATSRTNKAFVVEVRATESAYGTHVESGWRDKGMGMAGKAAARSMGSGVRTGLNAGRESALKHQVPAMEMEFAAFEREVLARYV